MKLLGMFAAWLAITFTSAAYVITTAPIEETAKAEVLQSFDGSVKGTFALFPVLMAVLIFGFVLVLLMLRDEELKEFGKVGFIFLTALTTFTYLGWQVVLRFKAAVEKYPNAEIVGPPWNPLLLSIVFTLGLFITFIVAMLEGRLGNDRPEV